MPGEEIEREVYEEKVCDKCCNAWTLDLLKATK